MGMFAIEGAEHWRSSLHGGEVSEVGSEQVDGAAQKERAEECKESGTGLGWKLEKYPVTSSLNDVACLNWITGPCWVNQDSTSLEAQASAGGLGKGSNRIKGHSPVHVERGRGQNLEIWPTSPHLQHIRGS